VPWTTTGADPRSSRFGGRGCQGAAGPDRSICTAREPSSPGSLSSGRREGSLVDTGRKLHAASSCLGVQIPCSVTMSRTGCPSNEKSARSSWRTSGLPSPAGDRGMQRPRLEAAVLSPHRRSTLAETYTAGLSPAGIDAQVRAKWECRTGLDKSYRRSNRLLLASWCPSLTPPGASSNPASNGVVGNAGRSSARSRCAQAQSPTAESGEPQTDGSGRSSRGAPKAPFQDDATPTTGSFSGLPPIDP
jgi:hypothetical protein